MISQNMSEATPPPRKRRRPALSCAECRRRKIKCDRNVPCSQCTLSKSPTCTYSGDSPRNIADHFSAPIRSLTPNSGRNIPNAVSVNGFSAGNSPDIISLVTGSQLNALSSPRVESPSSEREDLADRVKKLEQLLAKSVARNETAIPNPSLPKTSDTLRGTVSKTRYYGQSHWIYAFEQFEKIAWFKDLAYNGEGKLNNVNCFNAATTVSEVRSLLNNCKNLARRVKADLPAPILLPENFNDHVPQREVSDKLVHLYYRTQESTYRILHIPSFQKEYELYWNNPHTANTGFIVKLLLVMAVGTCFYQGNDSDHLRSQAVRWVYVAQHWMLSPFEKGRLNLSGLQVYCLRLLARQMTGVAGDLLWISAGALLRQAIQMGYHRDPKYLPPMSIFHSELRRRLWATIVEMNVQFSLDSGMQPHFSIDDFDTLPPVNLNDSDIDENTKVLPVLKPRTVYTDTSIQITLLKSLSTRLESIKLINGFRSEPSYDEVLQLGTQITAACKETSHFLHQSNSSSQAEHKPTALQSILLDISIRRFILALHRPFAIKARSDPRFYFSRKLSLDTAMNMLSHLSSVPTPTSNSNSALPPSPISHSSPNNPLLQSQDELTRLKLCGGTFFKEVMIHAAVIILFELVVQLEESQAESSFYPLQTKESREPLRQALRDIVELCAERIRLGENNVKGHLFISIALGQIEAMEEGGNVERGIVEAARVSAGICSGLLRGRMGMRNVNGATPGEEEGRAGGSWGSVEDGMEQDFGFDFMVQDSSFDFDIPESWVVSEWDENAVW